MLVGWMYQWRWKIYCPTDNANYFVRHGPCWGIPQCLLSMKQRQQRLALTCKLTTSCNKSLPIISRTALSLRWLIGYRLSENFDRIVVFENGSVVEYGEPNVLLADEGSKFKALWDSWGVFSPFQNLYKDKIETNRFIETILLKAKMLWSHRARSSLWTEFNRGAQARSFEVFSRLSSYTYAYTYSKIPFSSPKSKAFPSVTSHSNQTRTSTFRVRQNNRRYLDSEIS